MLALALVWCALTGLFGFSTIASVPVYCLLAKETLIYDAGVPPLPSFLLSNVLPWILVALTYNGKLLLLYCKKSISSLSYIYIFSLSASFFEAFVNWSGLLILGYANFSVPLMLDLKLMSVRAERSTISTKRIQSDENERTAKITKCVFIIVTCCITAVINMSVFNRLSLSLLAFALLVGVMMRTSI